MGRDGWESEEEVGDESLFGSFDQGRLLKLLFSETKGPIALGLVMQQWF